MRSDWLGTVDDSPETRPVSRRGWWDKFSEAAHGIKLGVRGQASFCVHFFFAVLAIAGALLLECDRVEWCLILICIGMVLMAELFNSALETLFHGLDPATRSRLVGVLDIAAGAVLLASLTAVLVGGIIFLQRLLLFTSGSS